MPYQIAQLDIGRMKAPLESSVMEGFVARLDVRAVYRRLEGLKHD